jgi:hypothetical protein
MGRPRASLLAALALVAAASGCDEMLGTGKPLTLTANDGRCSITVNTSWKRDTALNAEAVIGASNRLKELYVVVLVDEKQLIEQKTLQSYAEFVRGPLTRSIVNLRVGPAIPVKINGHDALQTQIHGRVDGVDIAYLHTAVETPTRFYQVLSWTLEERYFKNMPRLTQVVNSFQEIAR